MSETRSCNGFPYGVGPGKIMAELLPYKPKKLISVAFKFKSRLAPQHTGRKVGSAILIGKTMESLSSILTGDVGMIGTYPIVEDLKSIPTSLNINNLRNISNQMCGSEDVRRVHSDLLSISPIIRLNNG